jgi:lipid-A-disaccharide synthase
MLARLVMRVTSIGLPNVIAGRRIVPELWQYDVTADNMALQVLWLLNHPEHAAAMRMELAALRRQLGSPGVPGRVADGIVRFLETCSARRAVVGARPRLTQP